MFVLLAGCLNNTDFTNLNQTDVDPADNQNIEIISQIKNSELIKGASPSVKIQNIGKGTISAGAYSLFLGNIHCSDSELQEELEIFKYLTIKFNKIDDACVVTEFDGVLSLKETKGYKFVIQTPDGFYKEKYAKVSDSNGFRNIDY